LCVLSFVGFNSFLPSFCWIFLSLYICWKNVPSFSRSLVSLLSILQSFLFLFSSVRCFHPFLISFCFVFFCVTLTYYSSSCCIRPRTFSLEFPTQVLRTRICIPPPMTLIHLSIFGLDRKNKKISCFPISSSLFLT
jgi:hypothetical protein